MSFDHAFDWVRRHVASGALPTAVLGIANADGVVALDAFGGASVDDHYPLFSITKPIVGLAALHLVEEGRLTFDTPLSAAIPEFGIGRDDVVRLRHLASHTSGIPEPALDAPRQRDALLAGGRDFAAGTVSRYSTVAFVGIAALIEHAAGESWERRTLAVGERVGATGFTFEADASPHAPVDAASQGLDYAAFTALRAPGAGLLARAEDLLAVGSALLRDDGSLVAPVTSAAMRRPLTSGIPKLEPYPAARGQDWGFTWNLQHSAPSLLASDTFGHGGWAGTEFAVTPSQGTTFVLLTNVGGGIGRLGLDVAELHNAIAVGG